VATPLEPVVAVLVVMAPPGLTIVNTTLAPDAGLTPTVTVADIFTVARAGKGIPEMGSTVVVGGTTTLAVAVAVAVEVVFPVRVAVALIGLLLAVAVGAMATLRVVEALAPGAILGEELTKVPVKSEGMALDRLNALAVHPLESLLVTFTL